MKKTLVIILTLIFLFHPVSFGLLLAEDTDPSPTPEPTPEAVIETGEAASQASSETEVNTNVIDGSLTISETNLTGTESARIEIALPTVTSEGEIIIDLENNAEVTSTASAAANTGENAIITDGSGEIKTGTASALAETQNIVNTNIIASEVEIAIFNILANYAGDLIFPRPDQWLAAGITAVDIVRLLIANSAVIDNNLSSVANTGENATESQNSEITTGDAAALSLDNTIVNTNILSQILFQLVINNYGNWTGQVYNWSAPGSVEDLSGFFQINLATQSAVTGEPTATISAKIENNAIVNNDVTAIANTGGNEIKADDRAVIETGNAVAVAKTFNLINTNILASRVYLGYLNIFGHWSGNLIFAYPDLTVSALSGPEEVYQGGTGQFTIYYQNSGHDLAHNLQLAINLGSGPVNLGNLEKQSSGFYIFEHKFDAVGEYHLTAAISGSDPETDNTNNQASLTVSVVPKPQTKSENNGTPRLSLVGNNNVGDFVYPGDTITFEYKIKNEGDGEAKNAVLEQQLFSPDGEDLGQSLFNLGNIAPGKTAKLVFYFKLNPNILGGKYTTKAVAVNSNEIQTDFTVAQGLTLGAQTQTEEEIFPLGEEERGEVLGAGTSSDPKKPWHYFILALAGSLLLLKRPALRQALLTRFLVLRRYLFSFFL
jgi:hypothetical protein